MNWMDWSAPDGIEQRMVDGKRQVRTPLHGWIVEGDPDIQLKTWEYLGYRQRLAEAKRQERVARLLRLIASAGGS